MTPSRPPLPRLEKLAFSKSFENMCVHAHMHVPCKCSYCVEVKGFSPLSVLALLILRDSVSFVFDCCREARLAGPCVPGNYISASYFAARELDLQVCAAIGVRWAGSHTVQHVVGSQNHLPSLLVCFLCTTTSKDVEAELRVTCFMTSWCHLNGGHEGITRIYLAKSGKRITIKCPVHMVQFHCPGLRNSEHSLPKKARNPAALSTVVDLPLYLLHFYLSGTQGVYELP